jgi:DNA-binding PucR family transcriptional regulator
VPTDLETVRRFVRTLGPADNERPRPDALAPFADAVAELGTGPVSWAIAIADGLEGRGVVGRSPEAPTDAIARAVRMTAVGLLSAIAGDVGQYTLTAEQRVITAAAVRQSIPFAQLVRGFRSLQRQWAALVGERIEHYRPARDRSVLRGHVLDAIPAYFDVNIDAVITEYLAQRERLLAGHVEQRRELVDRLLRGNPVDRTSADRVLGVPLGGHHLGAVIRADRMAAAAAQAAASRVVASAAAALDSTATLELPAPDGARWVWLVRTREFGADYQAAFDRAPAHLHVAVGRPAQGPAGFRRTHLSARAAARAGARSWSEGGLRALLTHDGEAAGWLAEEELAGLAAPGADLAALRLTARRYLELGSVVAVAADLHVHRNTVIYRLKRIEDLVGHPLGARRFELWAALLLGECGTVPAAAR